MKVKSAHIQLSNLSAGPYTLPAPLSPPAEYWSLQGISKTRSPLQAEFFTHIQNFIFIIVSSKSKYYSFKNVCFLEFPDDSLFLICYKLKEGYK